MKKLFTISGLIVAAALTFGATGTLADRDEHRSDWREQSQHDVKSFTMSGTASGTLDGEVRIGRETVLITNKTTLHSTADGALAPGHYVMHRPVYVRGVIGPYGEKRATMIIVQDRRATRTGAVSVIPPGSE